MIQVKRLVLDVLKPHQPTCLELAKSIAAVGAGYQVDIRVEEVDEKTETVRIELEADDIDFTAVEACIQQLGAALHSIDEVKVEHSVSN